MDIGEIKREMDLRGWSASDLAKKLAINADGLRKLLAGKRPMTETLERHIERIFEVAMTSVLVYSIGFPDEKLRCWIPLWDEMSPRQRVVALKKVFRRVLSDLEKQGSRCLDEEDAKRVKALIVTELDENDDDDKCILRDESCKRNSLEYKVDEDSPGAEETQHSMVTISVIENWRRLHMITKKELALRLGITYPYLVSILSGKQELSESVAIRFELMARRFSK